MSAKLSQLLITPEENDRNTTYAYIAEPTPLEEKNFGTVLSIIDIESQDAVNEEIINLINEEITQNYYRSNDLEIDVAFENTLNLLNRKLQQIISEVGEEWLSKLNATIGVLKDNQMHFTQVGSINILLVQKNDIIKLSESSKHVAPNPLKIFSNISSGQITASSSVIFCTESILDYLSQEKIKKTLQENNAIEASNYITDLLHENNNAANFAAVIIKMLSATESLKQASVAKKEHLADIPTSNIEKTNIDIEAEDNDSMSRLVSKETATNELLAPSLWPSLKQNIKKIKDNIKPLKIHTPAREEVTLSEKIKTSEKTGGQKTLVIAKKIFVFLKNISLQILTGLLWLLSKFAGLFKNRKQYSSQFHSIPNKATGKIARVVGWFKKLSAPRKAFIILLIVILFLFSQSIIRQGKKQEQWQEQQQYEETIATISNKLGEAETKIIMNDLTSARALSKEANDLINTIPKDSNIWEEQGQDQLNKLQNVEEQVNFVVRFEDPQAVANFNTLGSDISIDKISLVSTNIFSFASNNESVYRYDLEDNEASNSVEGTGASKFKALDKDSAATVLAVLEDQSFVQFNPVLEKLSEVAIDFENQDTNIVDIKVFGSRVYALDTKNNQIFKSTKDGDEYSTGTAWIADETVDLSNTLNFAIDGSIYLLKDNGTVEQLFAGEKDSTWKLEESVSIEGASKIFTDDATTYLYILVPSQQRVIAFDKDGSIVKQYTASKWTDLKDMIIDEADNNMYLLNGTEIYQVEL